MRPNKAAIEAGFKKQFIKTLCFLSGVSEEYADATWFTLTDGGREHPTASAERHNRLMNKDKYLNHYLCTDCDIHWEDRSPSTNDDRCPKCDTSYQPYKSEDIDPVAYN